MNEEPLRDEREFKTGLELHTPGWAPGVRADISFRRLWDKRVSNYMKQSAKYAGQSEGQVRDRVEEADEFANIFYRGAQKSGEHGDARYGDFIAKLVAAALRDVAKIDDVSWLLDKMEAFQPVHVRLIVALPTVENASSATANVVTVEMAAKACGCSQGIARAALQELQQSGFVQTHLNDGRPIAGSQTQVALTDLGESLMDLIAEIDSDTE